MPQGDDVKGDGPEKATYARKVVKRHGAHVTAITESFSAALPRMMQNSEAMAAAKLLKSGAIVRMADLKSIGQAELKQKTLNGRKRNLVTELLSKAKNIKGLRGQIDAEELAELDPELKSLLDHRKATSGARKRPAADVEDSGAGAGPSASLTTTAPSSRVVGASGHASKKPKRSGGGGGPGAGRTGFAGASGGSGAGGEALFATDEAVAAAYGKDFL